MDSASTASNLSKLFVHSLVERRDEIEEKYEKAYHFVQTTVAGLSEKELHDTLQTIVCKSEKQHEDVCLGLVYTILSDIVAAPKTYRDLTLITRDGLGLVLHSLSDLAMFKYLRLTETAKKQLLWLIREMIRNQVSNLDNLVSNLMRQASGGDTSPKNLMLVEGLLDIFIENRTWVEKNPVMVGYVCYTYVRLIEDHGAATLKHLRDKEVKFMISLIRERFVDVMLLGRDFVRLLRNVARIPEFEALWKDILQNPRALHPTFTEVSQMLQTRTSRRYLQCRLTHDMERKLIFLTNSVKFGNHKRYQDWFQDRYLITPESHSLRSDFIRYIINFIHPSNDMLCSDIIPRWAIIGWLLTSCTNTVALSNAKLAIFYDWLFFDPNKDNIMNVEPGILVMFHSMRNHPMVSTTLLDFLCRIMKNFYPKYEDWIRTGVYNTLKKILEKQVISSLKPLFESPKLDRDLKSLIRENFREFCSSTEDEESHDMWNDRLFGRGSDQLAHLVSKPPLDGEPKFSDDEDEKPEKDEKDDADDDDLPLSRVRLKSESGKQERVDLPPNLQKSFDRFVASKSMSDFESVLSDLRTAPLDTDQESYVHTTIGNLLKATTPDKIFPESKTDDKLAESISHPIFALFKILYQAEEKCKKCILSLFAVIHARYPTTGGLLLYFLKVYAKLQSRKSQNSAALVFKTNVYKLYCDQVTEKAADTMTDDDAVIELQLNKDLADLETYCGPMFLWLLPDVYREFKDCMVNNSEALKTLVGCIDAKNLSDLVYSITQGKLVIFKGDGIVDCLRDSLDFETFEQYCVWQLVQAHDIPIEYLQDLLPELETATNPEALTAMLTLLKNETPNSELIRLLLSRETKSRGDQFVTSVLRIWCRDYEEKLSEIIANLLTSKYPINSPNKRKRPPKTATNSSNTPSSEQLLNHLEHFRRSCRHGDGTGTGMYVYDTMQKALQQAFSHSSDSQKKQFSDLFGLAAEDDPGSGTLSRRGGSRGGRKQPTNKKESSSTANSSGSKKNNSNKSNNFNSDDEWSDDEWSKQKTSKRRKKAVMSDSD